MKHALPVRRALARLRVLPRLDVAIAAGFIILVAAEASAGSSTGSDALRTAAAPALAMAALAWRRQFPLAVAAVVIAAVVVFNPEGEFSTLLALVLAAFTVGAESEPPRSYAGLALVVVPFVAGIALEGLTPSDLAAAGVFLVGPWVVGTLLRDRSARAATAVARADWLVLQQEAREREAAARERTRIARELHDIVSHSISVVAVQTQAVRRRLGPEQSREAEDLARVESLAREAMTEMRRLFGVLRADGESALLTPQPGLGELSRLVEHTRASGLDVDLEVDEPLPVLTPGLDLTAYRILQEALTNALRHSGARRSTVVVRRIGDHLVLSVGDDGVGLGQGSEGGGLGLVGVRERVALYGGTLDVAAGPAGGVMLTASLPLERDE